MSDLVTAARPYARAILELADSEKALTKWSKQLQFMAAVSMDPDFQRLIGDPKLTKEEVADLFITACGDDIDESGQNLIKLLAENGRIAVLPELSMLFDKLRADAQGTVEAEVYSAYRLSKEQRQALEKALKKRLGRKVKITSHVDKSLLGGALIRAGDLVIDGSLKGRIEKLNAALTR
jgi:F-type H+-transporting ATPase subunit delta